MKIKGEKHIFFLSAKVGIIAFLLFLIPITSQGITDYSPNLVDLTNQTRIAFGLPALKINERLQQAAQLKINDMFQNNYFEHISPSGKSPWYFLEQVDYQYKNAGENLAMDYVEIKDAQQAWMQSPTHRKLILTPQFKEIGVAYQMGKIDGHQTILVVALFGEPEMGSLE